MAKSKKKNSITVKSSWREVTLRDFIKIGELSENKDLEGRNVFMLAHIASILSGVPVDEILEMDKATYQPLLDAVAFTSNEPNKRKNVPFKVGNKDFKWVPDFNALSLGEQVSIEQMILDAQEDESANALPFILAVILRPVDPDGNITKFDASKVNEHAALFMDNLFADKIIHEINFIIATVKN